MKQTYCWHTVNLQNGTVARFIGEKAFNVQLHLFPENKQHCMILNQAEISMYFLLASDNVPHFMDETEA